MSKKHSYALPEDAVREKVEHRRSGAAGIHLDQKASVKNGHLKTNRSHTRQNRKRQAIDDSLNG